MNRLNTAILTNRTRGHQAVLEEKIFENDGQTTDGRMDDGSWVYYKLILWWAKNNIKPKSKVSLLDTLTMEPVFSLCGTADV